MRDSISLLFAILPLFLAVMTSHSRAETIVVDLNGNGDFDSIQAAVDAAAAGDVIVIIPGSYVEFVVITNLAITIRNADPIDPQQVLATRIEGPGGTSAFSIAGGNSNVTIQGLSFDSAVSMDISEEANVAVEDCVIAGSVESAVFVVDAQASFDRCTFAENNSLDDGGAVSCFNSTCAFNACTFSNNSALCSGGAIGSKSCNLQIFLCSFENNLGNKKGGAISSSNDSIASFLNSFQNNSCEAGGGAVDLNNSSEHPANFNPNSRQQENSVMPQGTTGSEFVECSFVGNSTTGTFSQGGGAIQIDGVFVTISDCDFENNTAFADEGGAIQNINGASPLIETSCFFGNAARFEGGAIKNSGGSNPSIIDCIFEMNMTTNATTHEGGAIVNTGSSPVIEDCLFIANSSRNGGAIFNQPDSNGAISDPFISNCMFMSNSAETGGAISNFVGNANLTLLQCDFQDNSANIPTGLGGAIFNRSMLIATDCHFTGNNADTQGGAVESSIEATSFFDNCSFESNTTNEPGSRGGAIFNRGELVASACQFSNNSSVFDGGALVGIGGNIRLNDCTFAANGGVEFGGAIGMQSGATCTAHDCQFDGNSALFSGGNVVHSVSVSATFVDCRFLNASAGSLGGAIAGFGNGPQVVNCEFINNVADSGGAIGVTGGNVSVFGSQFNGNTAANEGGALAVESTEASFINCTITHNQADNLGDGISAVEASTVDMANSILFFNGDSEIHISNDSSVDVSFSIVSGGMPGIGNLDSDPLFVDSDGPDGTAGTGDENLALQSNSPAVDAGNNNEVPVDGFDLDGDNDLKEPIPFDLRMRARFVDNPNVPDTGIGKGTIVDMGAIEFTSILLGDVNLDGNVNLLDVGPFIERIASANFQAEADCNQDGRVDLLDVEPFIDILSN